MVPRSKVEQTTRRSFLAGSAFVALSGCIGSSESPTDQHPDRSSPEGPTRWTVEIGEEPVRPLSGQFVYAAAGTRVRGFDHSDGEEVWSQSVSGPVVDLIHAGELLHVVTKVVGERPQAFAPDIRITALQPETGEQQWQSEFGKRRVFASGGGRLFLAGQTDVVPAHIPVSAIDARTGRERWRRNTASPSKARVGQQRLYFAARDGIHAFDSASGEQRWYYEWSEFAYRSFVVGSDVVAGIEGSPRAGLTIHVLDRSGNRRWSFDEWNAIGLTAHNGRIYAGGERLGAFDAEFGALQWDREHGGGLYHAPVTSGAILSGGNEIRAHDVDDGTERWTSDVDPGYLSPAAVLDGTVYAVGADVTAGDQQRHAVGLDGTSGEQEWHLETDSDLTGSLYNVTASSEGVYVCEADGTLYALS